jgi:hypothetical protein
MNDDNFTERNTKLPSHIAFSVDKGKDDKNYRQKIGAAWPANNDDLTLKLSAIPLNGIVILRSREDLERLRAERQQSREDKPIPRKDLEF